MKRWVRQICGSPLFIYQTLTPICNERDGWSHAGNLKRAERIQNVIDRAIRSYENMGRK